MLGFAAPPADIVFPVRVEPRAYFANERTLLNWFDLAATLTIVGAALQSGRNSFAVQSVGLALSCPAAAFVLYALRMYALRLNSLEYKRPQNFEDQGGTLLLALLLTVMIVTQSSVAILAAKAAKVAACAPLPPGPLLHDVRRAARTARRAPSVGIRVFASVVRGHPSREPCLVSSSSGTTATPGRLSKMTVGPLRSASAARTPYVRG